MAIQDKIYYILLIIVAFGIVFAFFGKVNDDEGLWLAENKALVSGKIPYLDFPAPHGILMMLIYGNSLILNRLINVILLCTSSWLVYKIVLKNTKSEKAALLSSAFFGLNSLVLYGYIITQTYALTCTLLLSAIYLKNSYLALLPSFGRLVFLPFSILYSNKKSFLLLCGYVALILLFPPMKFHFFDFRLSLAGYSISGAGIAILMIASRLSFIFVPSILGFFAKGIPDMKLYLSYFGVFLLNISVPNPFPIYFVAAAPFMAIASGTLFKEVKSGWIMLFLVSVAMLEMPVLGRNSLDNSLQEINENVVYLNEIAKEGDTASGYLPIIAQTNMRIEKGSEMGFSGWSLTEKRFPMFNNEVIQKSNYFVIPDWGYESMKKKGMILDNFKLIRNGKFKIYKNEAK